MLSRSGDRARKHLNGHLSKTDSIVSAPVRGGFMETDEMRQLALPPNLLNYLKSIKRRFRNPLVEMSNGICMGCFMALSSGQRQKIENETTYGVCESCGRILYYEEL